MSGVMIDMIDNGTMPVSSLRDVLTELQFTINDEELAQVLLDLRKKSTSTLNFRYALTPFIIHSCVSLPPL
jgi:Ca2+-binding EF-hand superfamily protein